jgi:hypothetical protein
MDRAEIIRQILEIAAQLTPEEIAEVIEEQKKTAPVSHTEAVSVEKHQQR